MRPKPCSRQAEATRAGRDVEEPLSRLETDEAERLVREINLLGSDVPVVALRDCVPRFRRRGVLFRRGSLTHDGLPIATPAACRFFITTGIVSARISVGLNSTISAPA